MEFDRVSSSKGGQLAALLMRASKIRLTHMRNTDIMVSRNKCGTKAVLMKK